LFTPFLLYIKLKSHPFEEAKVIGSSLLDSTAVANISSFTFGFANAGNIKLSTQNLILKDGGRTGSSTFGSGIGGNVLVNADSIDVVGVKAITFSPSVLDASTFASGNAGNLTINTSKLKVRNGGRVDTSTLASGNAGLLEVNASDSIEVSGVVPNSRNPSLIDSSANVLDPMLQQLFGLVDKPSGDAGSLTLNTRSLIIKNGAQVTVKNDGTGDAGTLEINANSVRLENKAGITASTESGQGGNIKINSDDWLLMRRNSRISTNAGNAQAGGDGGQINIDTKFLVAPPLENSDITTNAFEGKGGSVEISATAIFGFVPRSREELQTLLRTDNPNELDPARLPSNDITAISQTNPSLSGDLTIITPNIDPNNGLVDLPVEITDLSNSIGQECANTVGPEASKFIITGSGGLPEDPTKPLNGQTIWTDSRLFLTTEKPTSAPAPTTQPTDSTAIPLTEASLVEINSEGEAILTAAAPSSSLQVPWLNSPSCHAS
jgi:large exoprotein involved in heme utilization and adhesion